MTTLDLMIQQDSERIENAKMCAFLDRLIEKPKYRERISFDGSSFMFLNDRGEELATWYARRYNLE